MKALEIIQADNAILQIKRSATFDRDYYLQRVPEEERREYLAKHLDPYHAERMSPAAYRVLHVYIETGR